MKYRANVNLKDSRAAHAGQALERARNSATIGHPAIPKVKRSEPYSEQRDLGEGCNHVVEGRKLDVAHLQGETVVYVDDSSGD